MVLIGFLMNYIFGPPAPPPPGNATDAPGPLSGIELENLNKVLYTKGSIETRIQEGVPAPLKHKAFKSVLLAKIILNPDPESNNGMDNRVDIIPIVSSGDLDRFLNNNDTDIVRHFITNQDQRNKLIDYAIINSERYVPIEPPYDIVDIVDSIAYILLRWLQTPQFKDNDIALLCVNLLSNAIGTHEQAVEIWNNQINSGIAQDRVASFIATYKEENEYDLVATYIVVFCCFKIPPEEQKNIFTRARKEKAAEEAAALAAAEESRKRDEASSRENRGYDSDGGGKIKRRKRRKRRRTIKKRKGVVRRTKRSRK